MKGKSQMISIYELVSKLEEATESQKLLCNRQELALYNLFNLNDISRSLEILSSLKRDYPQDKSIEILFNRVSNFSSENQVPENFSLYQIFAEKA